MTTQKEKIVAELAIKRLRGESLDKLADEIVLFGNAVKQARATRLTDKTLCILIQASIGRTMSLKTIQSVLDAMCALPDVYLKPKEKK